MKKLFLTLLTAVFALAACVNKPTAEKAATGVNEYAADEAKADGIQRMQPYHYADTVRMDGHTYVYTIHREASDSLPMVVDDEGTRYADNVYKLTIQADGHSFFDRRFTKSAFASYLSTDFRAKGILDGMMFDETQPALTFAVSVSLPQSDMMEPLLLRIDRQGGIAIQRDERGEADLNATADDEDGV
ncbi:MAG: DUF4738 domain-containing protein [Bacteroidaceae bacterium]|nr:DUF4738 domain-containing protein [Bacteroidaceae bacterium]